MSARVFLPLFLALSVCVSGLAADAKKEASKEKPSSFDQFKQLAGEWTGKAADGKDEHEVAVTYKVTSAGSAVVETIMPGTDHEMVTMIHPDGDLGRVGQIVSVRSDVIREALAARIVPVIAPANASAPLSIESNWGRRSSTGENRPRLRSRGP